MHLIKLVYSLDPLRVFWGPILNCPVEWSQKNYLLGDWSHKVEVALRGKIVTSGMTIVLIQYIRKAKELGCIGKITSLPLFMFPGVTLLVHLCPPPLILTQRSKVSDHNMAALGRSFWWGGTHLFKVSKHERCILSPLILDSWYRNLQ